MTISEELYTKPCHNGSFAQEREPPVPLKCYDLLIFNRLRMHRPRQLCDQTRTVALHLGRLHQQGAIREACGRCTVVHRQQPLLQGVHGLGRIHIRAHARSSPRVTVCFLERHNRARNELPCPRT